ncbi:hypothetical protein HOLleu_41960 [Holothuria leucospilota]|uniref:C-type lectin domain-containing protein n=1 Tax=Holothuria leucospilota TaxID=206669 RepID=A0A9Q0YC85_HOLLE|nr:hypothetical protein HOLleu_41960 [Holothuria leucospilota]
MKYFFTLILWYFIVCHVSADCPEEFPYTFSCSCYLIVSSQDTSQPDAVTNCKEMSSHLVFIETETEKDFLSEIYDKDSQYWLGISGLPEEDKTWMDGSPVIYSAFRDHEYTFDDRSGCYRIVPRRHKFQPDRWQDAPCNKKYGFICEYEEPMCSKEVRTSDSPATSTLKPITTEMPEGIDVGTFFLLPPLGITISEGSRPFTLPSSHSKAKCVMHCAKKNCEIVIFDKVNHSCNMAIKEGSLKSQRKFSDVLFERSFVCETVSTYFICS